ncbi:MAG: tRNA preQ1(34) S-adenosylmethionine ribosyltransferase-isomerase QueA [Alphaproteobacteria bacterium]
MATHRPAEAAPTRVEDYDFDLSPEQIALQPASPRDAARLLWVRPPASPNFDERTERTVAQLPDLLRPGDALVLNDTAVIRAALSGVRHRIGADFEGVTARVAFNLDMRIAPDTWTAFARPAKRLKPGDRVVFGDASELVAQVAETGTAGQVTLRFACGGDVLDRAIARVGAMPLPPYIASRRGVSAADTSDYQTVFAKQPGAVAAPTAGLHFTDTLLAALTARGICLHYVTLHVGAGTFLPMHGQTIAEHKIHPEWGTVSEKVAQALNRTRANKGRIVAVGTTSLRILEASAADSGHIAAFSGQTRLYITPGHQFRAVDVLLTNFHLPRSSLLVLVSAFAGYQTVREAYKHAIEHGFRFYSYGDACLFDNTAEPA